MSFNALVSNAGRLEILAALAVDEAQDFVTLRSRTRLTDGNLASHARRLESGGLLAIQKSFRQGKPVTSFHLTSDGRKALESHVRRLMSALSQRRTPGTPTEPIPASLPTPAAPLNQPADPAEEWVD